MINKKNLPISVVIASIGSHSLFKTIDSIYAAKYKPKEIIISLPPDIFIKIRSIKDITIKIINSPKKGQVAQRAFGFKFVKQNYIVQCDDDIVFEDKTFLKMYENLIKLGSRNVVGPIYINIDNNDNITKIEDGFRGFIVSLYHKFICLAPWSYKRMGSLTKIGIGYGVDPQRLNSKNPFQVFWLNGGCVMCHRHDLILEDYFPFKGKAYFEDTIHSILWGKKKNKMWVIPTAKCFQYEDNYLLDDLKSYNHRFQIHKFVVNMIGGSILRLYVWRVFFLIKYILLRNIINVKK